MSLVVDPELVRRAARGDPAAAGELLRLIMPGVVRYCWAHLGSLRHAPVSPDDVAQEVCLAVFEALPRFRERGLPFAGFVFRIAGNKVADAYRSARAATELRSIEDSPEPVDERWDPERRAVVMDLSRRMLSLLGELTSVQREIVVLRVAAGLSADEVGAALDMSPAAVRMAQSRAMARLRERATEGEVAV